MCHPEYSTRWHKDYYQLVGEEYKSAYSYRFQIDHFRKILGDLKYIKFTGGEPLLIKEYEEILDAVIEVGNAKNIFLNYSTNLTIAPSPSLVDKWKKFKGIVFALSLDGVGPVIEYVRHPTKWKTVEQVIPILFSLSHQLPAVYSFRASVMPYNVLNIPETLLWWQGQAERHMKAPSKETNIINPTHIHYPEFLTLRVLPAEVKDFVSRKLLSVDIGPRENQAIRHLVNYMNGQDDSHLFPQFMSYTMALDELHGQSFLDVCPDIAGPILSLWQDRKLPAPADFIFRSVADASGE